MRLITMLVYHFVLVYVCLYELSTLHVHFYDIIYLCIIIILICVHPCMLILMIYICLSWMMHGKRKNSLLCKIGIVMPLLTFKFNAQIQGEFYIFDGLSMF
jgi:hypothetical protein